MTILDVSKVYDTVLHNKVLCKFNHYGINDNILKLIDNFLKQRSHWVAMDGETLLMDPCWHWSSTTWTIIISPVPKWLSKSVSSRIRLFAHDCLLTKQSNESKTKPVSKRPKWTTNMGWKMGYEHENPQIYRIIGNILNIKQACVGVIVFGWNKIVNVRISCSRI